MIVAEAAQLSLDQWTKESVAGILFSDFLPLSAIPDFFWYQSDMSSIQASRQLETGGYYTPLQHFKSLYTEYEVTDVQSVISSKPHLGRDMTQGNMVDYRGV